MPSDWYINGYISQILQYTSSVLIGKEQGRHGPMQIFHYNDHLLQYTLLLRQLATSCVNM